MLRKEEREADDHHVGRRLLHAAPMSHGSGLYLLPYLMAGAAQVGENLHEVVVNVTATVRSGEDTVFLVEVQQAGLFHIEGVPAEQMGWVLGVTCPNVLFPYARQSVSDLILRGGTVHDGLGGAARLADVAVQGGQDEQGGSDGFHGGWCDSGGPALAEPKGPEKC